MNSSSAKVFPTDEAIKKQIAKIVSDGNRPEDWKSYIDGIKLKAHAMDESKRNLILMYWYCNAFKSITVAGKSLAAAQMLVDYAWIKSSESVSDAENLLSYGRSNLRHFAVIHIASAELALKVGDKEKAKKLIKSAYSHGAEPISLIKEAAKRLCMGFRQLMCDEDSSSSSGHESSEPEMSGECSGSNFRSLGKTQEHPSSNFPGWKYDTEELQEGFDLFSKIKETGGNNTKTKDEDLDFTSPVKSSQHQEDSNSSPLMPKTPKTPAFSSQRFQSIFNSKRLSENTTEDNIGSSKQVPDDVIGDGVSHFQHSVETYKGLRENSGLLNLVTPCMKKKPEGAHMPVSSQKLGRNSSVSKLRSFAQPPQRVKVHPSSKIKASDENEDMEHSSNSIDVQAKELSQKVSIKKNLQQGLFNTPASKAGTTNNGILTSDSISLSVPFASSNTYSVHKNMTPSSIRTNTCDSEVNNTGAALSERKVNNVGAAAIDRNPVGNDQVTAGNKLEQKPLGNYKEMDIAKNVIKASNEDNQGPVYNLYKDPRNVQSELGGQQWQNEQKLAQQKKNIINVGNSCERRENPQPTPPLPQAFNPPMQQPAQNGQTLRCVNSKPYIVTRLIGRGGSAKVYQVQDSETFEMKALKSVNLVGASPQILEGYKNEIALLKKLQGCDCVIRLYDSEYDQYKKKLLVVMEFGETDLANFLAKNGSINNQDELYPVTVCYLWGNMVKAVRAMHKEGVIHSDLKPANFIFVSGNIKLIDFGIANSIQQDKTSMLKDHKVGTPSYMSPEALMTNNNTDPNEEKPMYKIGFKSDVWSLGCILYQMVYGQTPFYNFRYKMEAIVNPAHVIKFPPLKDEALTDILQKCLTRDVKARPTTEQLMMHPYLTKQRTETPVNDPISNLMSEGASIASASPRSQQAFCLKFQKAMELMNSAKKHPTSLPK